MAERAEQEIGIPGSSSSGVNPPIVQPKPTQSKEAMLKELQKANPEQLLDLIVNKPADEFRPWEDITLPSLGYFYEGKIPGGLVKIRPMNITADKILTTTRLAQTGQSIDYIFRDCVQLPAGFDPLNLLFGDRTFLLWYLRGITYGNIYEFSVTCTNDACGQMSSHEYDLNLLAGNIKQSKITQEPIRIKLPEMSKITGQDVWVDARFMRGYDMMAIMQSMRAKKAMQGNQARSGKPRFMEEEHVSIDQSVEDNLSMSIISVNGNTDRAKIKQFITRLHARDTSTIRDTLNDNSPGIDAQIVVNCQHCNTEMKMDLPFTETFFRPKK